MRRSTDSRARLLLVARFPDRVEQWAYKPEERVRAAFHALDLRGCGADTEELALVRDFKGNRHTVVWL